MDGIVRQRKENYALATLPLFLAFRKEEEKSGRERDGIKVLQRDAANDNLKGSRRETESPKTPQTFMMVSIGEVSLEVQGYGNVKVVPHLQYLYGVSTRSYGVPTNFNVVVAPGTGGMGYAVPYHSNEFQEAA